MLAVRTRHAKLITYPGHDNWTELFNLAADPYERRNVAAEPNRSELLRAMQRELARQKKLFGDPFAQGTAARNQ